MNNTNRIVDTLSKYQNIKNIVQKNNLLYRLKRDQYSGNTPDQIKEHTLSSVLFNSDDHDQYSNQLTQLDDWLGKYPDYVTKKFGDKLVENFFSFHSEIEVYHHLKKECVEVERDVNIGYGNENLDFKINLSGRDFLIEVVTPRSSFELEYGLYSGNSLPEWGGKESIENVVNKEIKKHFEKVGGGFSTPVILIVNVNYTADEIEFLYTSKFMKETPPDYFYGIVLYKNALPQNVGSHFYPNPNFELLDKESKFFDELMRS